MQELEDRINVNATGSNGLNALHTAALYGRSEILNYLLRCCGADVDWPSAADGRTSLHIAIMAGNVSVSLSIFYGGLGILINLLLDN